MIPPPHQDRRVPRIYPTVENSRIESPLRPYKSGPDVVRARLAVAPPHCRQCSQLGPAVGQKNGPATALHRSAGECFQQLRTAISTMPVTRAIRARAVARITFGTQRFDSAPRHTWLCGAPRMGRRSKKTPRLAATIDSTFVNGHPNTRCRAPRSTAAISTAHPASRFT